MAFTDDYESLLNALGLGPNDWRERLKPYMEFKSPEGSEFKAKWRGSPRTVSKKLGIFSYPKVKGDVVEDMEVFSNRFRLTFYFDGDNNDKTAAAFFYAIKESGTWEINHPVHGFFELQPISVEEIDNPVESGNITEISSEWIEPIDPDTEQTARELAGIVDGLGDDLGLGALQAFVDAVNTASETLEKTLSLTAMAIENGSEKALSPLTAVNDLIYNTQLATQRSLQRIYNATVLDSQALGAQMQDLLRNPSLAISDIDARLSYYDDMQDELFDTLPGGLNSQIPTTAPANQKKNSTLTCELGLNAVTQARSQIAITGPLKTRAHAVGIAEEILDRFNAIHIKLEEVQTDLSDQLIENQYFANGAYGLASNLVGQTVRYLLLAAFDLKVERKFTLDRPRAPIEIAVTEYGDLGSIDDIYDLFIESNDLQGDDLLLLPAGRQVVIYV